ncbi:unnamed protein product [Auanema sp. JU1783]|nr:unnamed protein product [Auanema sp. JU1783]
MTRRNVNRAPSYVYHANGINQEVMRTTVASPASADTPEEPRATQRGWKSINSQYCVVCKEGGNILCCDNCPASFHLMCHEPIISPDDIPEGNWLCNRCSTTPEDRRTPKDSIDSNVDVDDYELKKNQEVARTILGISRTPDDPLSLLLEAAKSQNATLFELPPEYDIDQIVMAGDARPPRPEIKDEVCDFCRSTNSCPMVQCDFCGNIYHLDCVEPPLIGVPKKRWMCPSHVEHIVDQKLAKSVSIVKRRELYKRFCRQTLNEPEIIGTFLKKIKKRRALLDPNCEHAELMDVPAFVKCLYAQRTRNDSSSEHKEGIVDDAVQSTSAGTNASKTTAETVSVVPDPTSQPSGSSDQDTKNKETDHPIKARTASESTSMDNCLPGPSSEKFSNGITNLNGSSIGLTYKTNKRRNPEGDGEVVLGSEKRPLIRGFCQRGFCSDKSILAVLKAEGYDHPFAIQKAVTTIGVSRNCDIRVVEILESVCNNLSPIHATIVFDKVIRRFELLPSHGAQAIVDGITYGATTEIQNLSCKCSTPTNEGALQSAPLRHGSHISMGCLSFVFASYY